MTCSQPYESCSPQTHRLDNVADEQEQQHLNSIDGRMTNLESTADEQRP
ncbi:hypothetical protein A2U01_0092939, partial [Trifolium medium]|nr:hypothetical protein [Trifolium medium]